MDGLITWVKDNRIISAIIIVVVLLFIGSAWGGISDWFQKRAEIKDLKTQQETLKKDKDQKDAEWRAAYSVKEEEYSKVSRERDSLRKKIKDLQNARPPFISPATDNDLLLRFKALGY